MLLRPILAMDSEVVVAQCIAAIRRNSRGDQNLPEEGARVVAQIPIGNFIIRRELWFQREPVKRLPFAVKRSLEHESVVERQQTMRLMRRALLDMRFQAQRSC